MHDVISMVGVGILPTVVACYVSPRKRWRYIALPPTAHLFARSVLCLCILSVYPAGSQTRDVDGGYCSVDSMHWPSVDLVPGRRRRRWTGIESASGLFLLFAG